MRKILFNKESEILQPIIRLIENQKHRTLVMWSLDCSQRMLEIFENNFPNDHRPRNAIETAKLWAKGEIKMPVARKAILTCHSAAKEVINKSPASCAAARAIGHAASTIHVKTHAIGIVMYGLTAFVYDSDKGNKNKVIDKELNWFYDKLIYWEKNIDNEERKWADFLLKDDIQNS